MSISYAKGAISPFEWGRARTPADLDGHSCIAFVLPSTGRILAWSFSPRARAVHPQGLLPRQRRRARYRYAGSRRSRAHPYDFLVASDVVRGALVEVLAAHRGASRPFSLVYPRGTTQSRATRTMIDFTVETERTARSK